MEQRCSGSEASAVDRGLLQPFRQEPRYRFLELDVVRAERVRPVGVNVNLAPACAALDDGHDDFRAGFKRAGDVAGIGLDVRHDLSLARSRRRAADALPTGMLVCTVGLPWYGPSTIDFPSSR